MFTGDVKYNNNRREGRKDDIGTSWRDWKAVHWKCDYNSNNSRMEGRMGVFVQSSITDSQ